MSRREDESVNLLRGNTELILLAVLRDGPAYGYSLAKEIDRRAQGALSLKQGSIYPLLYSLEEAGHITSEWSTPIPGERPRRMYRISESGLRELDRRLETFLNFSRAVMRTAGLQLDGEPLKE